MFRTMARSLLVVVILVFILVVVIVQEIGGTRTSTGTRTNTATRRYRANRFRDGWGADSACAGPVPRQHAVMSASAPLYLTDLERCESATALATAPQRACCLKRPSAASRYLAAPCAALSEVAV